MSDLSEDQVAENLIFLVLKYIRDNGATQEQQDDVVESVSAYRDIKTNKVIIEKWDFQGIAKPTTDQLKKYSMIDANTNKALLVKRQKLKRLQQLGILQPLQHLFQLHSLNLFDYL